MQNSSKPFQLYNASAGSGKTYNLVKNIISLLFKNAHKPLYFSHIMAVTFTNKAAYEMKNRLLNNLKDMASEEYANNEMLQTLSKELNEPIEDLHRKADKILKQILHNYSLLSFYTLDKFNLRLMKSFTRELNLSYGFGVEIENDTYYEEAFLRYLDSFSLDSPKYQSLLNFYLQNIDEEKNVRDVNKNTLSSLKKMETETNFPYIKKNIDKDLNQWNTLKKQLWENIIPADSKIKELAIEAVNIFRNQGLDYEDFNGGKSRGLLNFLENISRDGVQSKNFNLYDRFQESKYSKKTHLSVVPTIQSVMPQVLEIYGKMNKIKQYYDVSQVLIKELMPLQIYTDVKKNVEDIKKEEDIIFISEFNSILSEHLQEEPSAFIYEKLGNRYLHFYFDEFQDTSQMQWNNFQPLLENIYAQSVHETVSIIGDPKQSIYRFRGGKPEIMLGIIEQAQIQEEMYQQISLNTNYRSKENIVQFNNQLYAFLSTKLENPLYQSLFNPLAQQNPKTGNTGGKVQFRIYNPTDYAEKELDGILECIENSLSRGYKPHEMAILVQTNQQGNTIAQFLQANSSQFEVATEDSLFLQHNDAVQAIIQLFYSMENPINESYFFHFVYYLHRSSTFFKEELDVVLMDIFKKKESAMEYFQEKYALYFTPLYSQSLDVFDFTEKIIRKLQFHSTQQNYCTFLLEVIAEKEKQSSLNIGRFLEYWNEKGSQLKISSPENENAISIMTLHKAKGLEFKVVILPNYKNSTDKEKLWIPTSSLFEELEYGHIPYSVAQKIESLHPEIQEKTHEKKQELEVDEMCRYYVATTRAEEELYIFLKANQENYFREYVTAQLNVPSYHTKNKDTFNDCIIDVFEDHSELLPPSSSPSQENITLINYQNFPYENKLQISREISNPITALAIEKGNRLHALLSQIQTAEDIHGVIENAFQTHLLKESEKEIFRTQLNKIVNHPEIREFYQSDYVVYNEREFISQQQLFRPDRLMKKASMFSIIDYKSGAELPKHKTQISTYKKELENLGYSVNKAILVYIQEPIKCVEVL